MLIVTNISVCWDRLTFTWKVVRDGETVGHYADSTRAVLDAVGVCKRQASQLYIYTEEGSVQHQWAFRLVEESSSIDPLYVPWPLELEVKQTTKNAPLTRTFLKHTG